MGSEDTHPGNFSTVGVFYFARRSAQVVPSLPRHSCPLRRAGSLHMTRAQNVSRDLLPNMLAVDAGKNRFLVRRTAGIIVSLADRTSFRSVNYSFLVHVRSMRLCNHRQGLCAQTSAYVLSRRKRFKFLGSRVLSLH